ncbi:hypothetical protein GCK72_022880 [Caenorhabditis remanei]|uniref:Uncharacterized protein n=1 Tax=Caenorhabditis remanei TaxID=31234 RepID=A0A6A5FV93_CAERE|nr:hypothetical protein GCK72_022880 [Caenorhabditis remanei]KAF1746425.1 hypothetical protein GCK72_022880 [Caenorhabditis remanei]
MSKYWDNPRLTIQNELQCDMNALFCFFGSYDETNVFYTGATVVQIPLSCSKRVGIVKTHIGLKKFGPRYLRVKHHIKLHITHNCTKDGQLLATSKYSAGILLKEEVTTIELKTDLLSIGHPVTQYKSFFSPKFVFFNDDLFFNQDVYEEDE